MTSTDVLSAEDRVLYETLKTGIRQRLRRKRAISEESWDTGAEMLTALARGWWKADLASPEEELSREQWAERVFEMTGRQARKYFAVAERLTREAVAGTGLCLDRLYQLALAPEALRPLVLSLGQAGLSDRALSAGRCAALPHLAKGEEGKALRAAQRAARARDRRDEKEDTAPPEQEPEDEASKKPDPERACGLVEKALREVKSLAASPDRREPGQLASLKVLLALTEELGDSVRGLLGPEGPRPGPEGPPAGPEGPEGSFPVAAQDKEPPQQPAEAQEKAPSPVPARPAAGGTSFRVMFDAVGQKLDIFKQGRLEAWLYRVIAGAPLAELMPGFRALCDELVEAGVPRALCDKWLELIQDPDWERRGAFALWFFQRARLPAFFAYLQMLREQDLAPGLRQKVEALWAGPAPSPSP
jgi:hypothetical protein